MSINDWIVFIFTLSTILSIFIDIYININIWYPQIYAAWFKKGLSFMGAL